MENNQFLAFFAELVKRLFAKSPLFFRIITIVGIIVAIITGLPAILTALNVTLPDFWLGIENKVVAIAAIVGTFISMLTVERTALVPGNQVVTAQAEGKVFLPFTAIDERNKIQATAVPANKPASKPRGKK